MRRSAAEQALATKDPVLADVIRELGPCRLRRKGGDPFASLVQSVVSQMISTQAAKTVYARLLEVLGEPSPSADNVARRRVATLRKAGLSNTKATAIRELAKQARSGALPLDDMDGWSDAEIKESLVSVPGIGPWTVNMFLMFHLARPDIFPAKDLGVQEGIKRVYGLPQRPTAAEAKLRAAGWAPHRSTAAWYMWRVLDGPTEF